MNFATLGLDLFGIALLLMPLIILSFLPILLMWQAHIDGERMARAAAELIEKRMRG
jgi:hypothetical protein